MPQRSVSKRLENIVDTMSSAVSITTLVNAITGIRMTFLGLKGVLSVVPEGLTAGNYGIVIIHRRAGAETPNLDLTDGGQIFDKKGDVLWNVLSRIDTDGDETLRYDIDIKTRRVLKDGDTIQLVHDSTSTIAELRFSPTIFILI